MILILQVIKKIWPYMAVVLSIALILGYVFHMGKRSCENSMNRAIIELKEKQEREIEQLLRRGTDIKEKTSKPLPDDKSSCILSNNPFRKDCGI